MRQLVDARLVDVADDCERADHVSVESAIADSHLAFIAGGEDERAEFIGQRHEQGSADARLEVLFGEAEWGSCEERLEQLLELAEDVVDGEELEADAEIPGELACVGDGAERGVLAGHADTDDVFGTESLDRDSCDECGVDASTKANEHFAEAAFADVVTRAEHERLPDLGDFVARGMIRVGEVLGVDEDEVLGEAGRAGDDVTFGREHDRGAVEDEAVVAADLVDHEDEGVVMLCDGREHALADLRLALIEGRGGDVEDEARMTVEGRRLRLPLAHERVDGVDGVELARPEALVVPCVLADGDRERLAVDHGERLRNGGLEVTLLVEDVVEGQQHLLLDECDLAAGEKNGDVTDALAHWRVVGHDRADEERGAAGGRGPGGDLVDGLTGAGYEGGLFQEVGWRVAADGEFREDCEVSALFFRTGGVFENLVRVAGEVPHRRVDLRESYLHDIKSNAFALFA